MPTAVGSVRYVYRCQVMAWLDGDTCKLDVDLGFGLHHVLTVRVAGINAPELHSRDPVEKAAGREARAHAEQLAPTGCFVLAQTAKNRDQEKFGRWLATITLDDGKDFALQMIAAGQARPYDGGKRL